MAGRKTSLRNQSLPARFQPYRSRRNVPPHRPRANPEADGDNYEYRKDGEFS